MSPQKQKERARALEDVLPLQARNSAGWGQPTRTTARAQRGGTLGIWGWRSVSASSLSLAQRRSGGGHFRRGVRTESGSAAAAGTAAATGREALGPVSTADRGQRALPAAAFCDLAVSPTSPAWRGKEDEGAAASSGVSADGVAGRAGAQPEGCGRTGGQAGAAAGDWPGRVPGPRAAGPRPGCWCQPRAPFLFRLWPSAWGGTSRFLASPSHVCSVFLSGVSPEPNKETWACSTPHSLGGWTQRRTQAASFKSSSSLAPSRGCYPGIGCARQCPVPACFQTLNLFV